MKASLRALAAARTFLTAPLPYSFTDLEGSIIDCFFTNRTKRVAFLKNLPETAVTALLSMYSRMTNSRGARGIFVDSWIPSTLSTGLTEVIENEKWSENPLSFLAEKKITCLQEFIDYSTEAAELVGAFLTAFQIPKSLWASIASSIRARRFISVWLDKYGHNSIARMGVIHFLVEGVSILTAKSIEWTRPGAGYVELSSRYVNLANALLYPIWEEWDISEETSLWIQDVVASYFTKYREMQGSATNNYNDGYFGPFLRETYGHGFEKSSELDMAVFGELCDVGGNFLPNCTCTSLGVTCSGESFPSILRHLILDGTAENLVLVELLLEESALVGADQFARHYEPTPANVIAWNYLDTPCFSGYGHTTVTSVHAEGSIETTLLNSFGLWAEPPGSLEEAHSLLFSAGRGEYDKLPREFEVVTVAYKGVISYRGWRDLHRMGMSTHKRTLATPDIGFYWYDKPAPGELHDALMGVADASRDLYEKLLQAGIDTTSLQYILPMGWLVGYMYAANLRQQDFVAFQRGKPDVNHEVRQKVLEMHVATVAIFPEWEMFSRGDRTPAYAFARGNPKIPL